MNSAVGQDINRLALKMVEATKRDRRLRDGVARCMCSRNRRDATYTTGKVITAFPAVGDDLIVNLNGAGAVERARIRQRNRRRARRYVAVQSRRHACIGKRAVDEYRVIDTCSELEVPDVLDVALGAAIYGALDDHVDLVLVEVARQRRYSLNDGITGTKRSADLLARPANDLFFRLVCHAGELPVSSHGPNHAIRLLLISQLDETAFSYVLADQRQIWRNVAVNVEVELQLPQLALGALKKQHSVANLRWRMVRRAVVGLLLDLNRRRRNWVVGAARSHDELAAACACDQAARTAQIADHVYFV